VSQDRGLTLARFAGWMACTLPTVIDLYRGRLTNASAAMWVLAFAVFGASEVRRLLGGRPRRRARDVAGLALQALAGLAMVSTAPGMTKYLNGITMTIVAADLPHALAGPAPWAWIALQTTLLVALFATQSGWLAAISAGGAFAGFQIFAVGQTLLELRERDARDRLAALNAELVDTRARLAQHARAAERLRISRDLHDAVGHHLTALSIQLDLASRQSEGDTAARFRDAHALTRLVLGDVREVVGELRESGAVDVAAALKALRSSTGGLAVHVELPEEPCLLESRRAHAVVRAAQEILTNAARHSRGADLWLKVTVEDGFLCLHGRDNGRGAATVQWGHGLTGLRERFEEHGGRVECDTRAGAGFTVHALMPALALPRGPGQDSGTRPIHEAT
jgi:signal transduction histidine kinase